MTQPTPDLQRSYGCTFGCGNPYDFILIDVVSGTTEFLCLPDFARLAADMVAAVTNAGDPSVIAAMAYAASDPTQAAPGPGGRGRGKNAPATTVDPDLYAHFDGVITEDDLPAEFRASP